MTLHNVLIIAEKLAVSLLAVLFIIVLGVILVFDVWFMRILGLFV